MPDDMAMEDIANYLSEHPVVSHNSDGWHSEAFDVPDELFKEIFGEPRVQRRRLVTRARNQGKTHDMRLSVKQTPAPETEKPVRQMEVGILYLHTLTGSIILCTHTRIPKTAFLDSNPWTPAKGICLVKGKLNRREWVEYPMWNFIEPKNYEPYKGSLTLQNEFREGEG